MAYTATVIQAVLTVDSGATMSIPARVPRNCSVVTFFTPAAMAGPMVAPNIGPESPFGGSPQWKIRQAVSLSDSDSNVYVDAYTWDLNSKSLIQLTFPFIANAAISFPAWYLGAGDIRISTYDVTQPAAISWTVYFSGFHN